MNCKERYPFDLAHACVKEDGHVSQGVPHTLADGRTWLASRSYASEAAPVTPELSDEQVTRIAKRVFRYLAGVPDGGEPFLTPTAANCHDYVVPRIEEAILSVVGPA